MLIVALVTVACLVAGYFGYGRFIARRFRLDDHRVTPATQRNDGVDFVPAKPFELLAQHFSAIAAAGPIVGPILACQSFGWLPCILWIIIGVVFIGAVHDFAALVASVRHGAGSIAEIARRNLSPRAWVAIVAFIWVALLYVLTAFTAVTAETFIGVSEEVSGEFSFNKGGAVAASSVFYLLLALVMGFVQRYLKPPTWLSALIFVPATLAVIWLGTRISTVFVLDIKSWYAIILGYCFLASMLPLWMLQQPRGFLGGFVLYLAIAVGLFGLMFGGKPIQAPVVMGNGFEAMLGWISGAAPAEGAAPVAMTSFVFPFLFVTIACGACSGFHGLVCGGTTSRQISRESHCTPVAFGGMLLEGLVAVIALSTIMVLTREQSKGLAAPVIYGEGLAASLDMLIPGDAALFARTFGTMAVATFVFDTIDVSTRLARYLIQELFRTRSRVVGAIASLVTVSIPLAVLLVTPPNSWRLFWTLFGTSNQLLASLTLIGITVWLVRNKRKCWFVAIPMVLVLSVTLTALSLQIIAGARDALAGRTFIEAATQSAARSLNPTVLNAGVAVLLAALAALFIVEALRAARKPAEVIDGSSP